MFAKNWFNAVPLSVRRVFTALLVLLLAFPAQSARADAGTAVLVADIRSGPAPSSPSYMTVFNGALYFRANDGTNGAELMKYDGSSVSLVADINPGSGGSNPAYLTVYNNALYFQADDGTNGAELWKYTGSGAPTLVKNIYPGTKPVFFGWRRLFFRTILPDGLQRRALFPGKRWCSCGVRALEVQQHNRYGFAGGGYQFQWRFIP